MATETDAPSAPQTAPRRRNRLVRRLVAVVLALVLMVVAATAGIGWYFSGVATEVEHGREYRLTVLNATADSVTLPNEPGTRRPGLWGLEWANGRAIMSDVIATTPDSVTRKVDKVTKGSLTKGTRAAIDHWVYGGDPKSALGLDFEQVTYPSQVGPMPAWLLPGTSLKNTWVIAVHGHSADRAETFRAMNAVRRTGLPMLSIAYRNDENAPTGNDGRNLLGHTEWNEVASAMDYARSRGATGFVLYGWSMGGAMVMKTLRTKPAQIKGVVLDSPVMDWGATLTMQGSQRGLPTPVTAVAKQILQWRTGIDLASFDQRKYAPHLKVPVLLFTTTEDATVDNGPSDEFARRAPRGLVTQVTEKADHTDAWNVARQTYEAALDTFLKKAA